MPSSHARLSASAAERWMHCPGSITLTERLKLPNTSSVYADEGTMAHSVAEWKVMHTESGPAYKKELKKWEASEFWCGEMDEATTFYANEVQDIYIRLLQQDAGTVRMVEQRIDLKEWIPGGFGTSDAVVIGAGEIHVVDLKYGKGVKVEAEGNPQLRLYGLGSASLFGDLYDFDTVVLHIIQPRLDHISTERIALKDLRDWGKNEVRPAADEAANGSERTACGDWCRFCPAKAVCRARAEENLALARMDFKAPMELTHDEIMYGIRRGTIEGKLTPVLCGTSYRNKGVQPLLDAIVDFLPSPLDIPPVKGTRPGRDEEIERVAAEAASKPK